MNVNDVMVTDVASCSPQTSLQDIAMLMWNSDCGAIPLVDENNHPVGIVTDRDIAMGAALQHRPLWEIRGEEITNGRELYCCGPDDTVQQALELMEQHEVRRLPVINQSSQLSGMVSLGDIVSFTGTERLRKHGNKHISSKETMEFLRHVSAHHQSHKAAATL
ncbi:CBS domain-containing protein [Saccharospirillum salsuginis]|uniref:Inosine-5-monophosphate dehydrogenase n=1 Tax=Saccharospirillum salsuginis TaxID=418750 RepID=A0A918NJE1_9GAMM|nr:CBS domain-containing protein [Saccharospirillum salsuginis]GGX72154.1 inosine-5-monophosphate dehydrogenase [Saccharospirillum salsuginis]